MKIIFCCDFAMSCDLISFHVSLVQVTDLKLSVDLLEQERDFYFAKLRDIEILCQTPEVENLPVRVPVKPILTFSQVSTYVHACMHACVVIMDGSPIIILILQSIHLDLIH